MLFGSAESSEVKNRLPRSEDYARALYTFDIGQNDLHAGILSMTEEQVKTYIPTIINEFASVVQVFSSSTNIKGDKMVGSDK